MDNIDIFVTIFVVLAGLFCCASIFSFIDRKPFISLFMSFTAISIIGSVAMAVQW